LLNGHGEKNKPERELVIPKPTPRGKEKPRRLWGPGLHFSRPDAASCGEGACQQNQRQE